MDSMIPFASAFVYYASYLYFPAVVLIVWFFLRGRGRALKFWAGLFLAGITVLAYARFVEPRILVTRDHDIRLCTAGEPAALKVAVFSDTHNGLFGNALPMKRIVDRISTLSPDFVMVPGDMTYYPQEEDLPALFAPLGKLEVPVFVVMGNHDEGIPGPDLTDALTETLEVSGVTVLDGREAAVTVKDRTIRIAGMVDHWASSRDRRAYLPEAAAGPADLTLYLQHNPDVLTEAEIPGQFDLMVAGHTHGGQINLPLITCAVTLACKTLRYGYAELPEGNLFVTSGTGMVGLPMRFNVLPVIDMLNITYGACHT